MTPADMERLRAFRPSRAPAELQADYEAACAADLARKRVLEALRWVPPAYAIPAVADALCDWAALDPDAVAQAAARVAAVAAEMKKLQE